MISSAANLEKHVRALTDDIGIRLAGTAGEYKAAEYIRDEFLKYSPYVTIEEYPVCERYVESEKLEICIDGKCSGAKVRPDLRTVCSFSISSREKLSARREGTDRLM